MNAGPAGSGAAGAQKNPPAEAAGGSVTSRSDAAGQTATGFVIFSTAT